MYDIEEAIDRVMLSLEKRNRVMSAAEKERVAYHEAGHALVALMNCLACQLPSAVWENYTEMRQHNNLGMRHGFREHRCLTERQFLTLAGDFREDWMTDKTLDPRNTDLPRPQFSEPEMSESMAFWNNRLVLRMGRLKN